MKLHYCATCQPRKAFRIVLTLRNYQSSGITVSI